MCDTNHALKTAVLGFKACYFITFQALLEIQVRAMVSRYALKNVGIIQGQINDLEYTRNVYISKKLKNMTESEKHLLKALPCSILLHEFN